MRTLEQHLTTYASYHRDRRNIATHFVGIPMIVVGAFAFLARPGVSVSGAAVSPGLVALLLTTAFYLRLDRRFGLAMFGLLVPAFFTGERLGALSTGAWLAAAGGLSVVGWLIQFIGHAFEGKKPAFVDDLVGLLVGPLFLCAEAAFALGLRRPLCEAIEAQAGPTRARTLPAGSRV